MELQRVPRGTQRTSWLSEETRRALSSAIVGPNRDRCRYCNFKGTDERVKVHVEQHFLKHFCKCGLGEVSRDTMLEHVKKHRGNPEHGGLHKVDKATYDEFSRSMGWRDPPYYSECAPTLGHERPLRDARERIVVKGLRLEPPTKRQAKERDGRKR